MYNMNMHLFLLSGLEHFTHTISDVEPEYSWFCVKLEKYVSIILKVIFIVNDIFNRAYH